MKEIASKIKVKPVISYQPQKQKKVKIENFKAVFILDRLKFTHFLYLILDSYATTDSILNYRGRVQKTWKFLLDSSRQPTQTRIVLTHV